MSKGNALPYLLDTNILIYLFKNMGAVRARIAQCKDVDIRLCTPVMWELLTGAFKAQDPSSQLVRLQAVQARFNVVTFDMAAAEHAGRVRAHLEAQGTPIGPVDTQIAGMALANDLTLVTRNTREFGRVPGLRVENWFDG